MELERKKQNLQSYWEEESGLEKPQDVWRASWPFYIINYVASLLPDMIRVCHLVRSWPYAFNNLKLSVWTLMKKEM